jgi:Raf kinase inhibitor-like YbhB/YbcL family protein
MWYFEKVQRSYTCMRPHTFSLTALLMLFTAWAFPVSGIAADASSLQLSSSAFANGAVMPVQYTCNGANESPPLEWSGVPTNAKSLALIVEDPDAPSGSFVHWVVYDIPPAKKGMTGKKPGRLFPGGGEEGMNGAGKMGYMGPCPPPGTPHHYHFNLYAIDKNLNLGLQPDAKSVRDAMQGHVVASTEFVGIFGR